MSMHIGEEAMSLDASALGDYWPGIQLYYPPVKYAPSLGIYEDMEQGRSKNEKARTFYQCTHTHF